MDIGKRIIKLREAKGWSQRELANRVNLNASVMNRIESGDRPVKDHELAKISSILDVSSDYLLGRTDNPVIGESKSNLYFFDKEDLSDEDLSYLEQSIEIMKERARKRAEEKKNKNNK